MGLPTSLKKLLRAEVILVRKRVTLDEFGNDVPSAAETIQCALDSTSAEFATAEEGGKIKTTPSELTKIYVDAIGLRLGDMIEFKVLINAVFVGEGIRRKVTSIITYRDKKGLAVFQEADVETQ